MKSYKKILSSIAVVVSVLILSATILKTTGFLTDFDQALYFSTTLLIPLVIIAVVISGGIYLWQKLSNSGKASDNYFGLVSWPVTIIATTFLLLGAVNKFFSLNSAISDFFESLIPIISLTALLIMIVGAISYLRFKYVSRQAQKNAEESSSKIAEKARSHLGYLFWQGLFVLVLMMAIGGIVSFLVSCGIEDCGEASETPEVINPLEETAPSSTPESQLENQ